MVRLVLKRLKDDPLHLWLQGDVHIGNEEYHEEEYLEYRHWFEPGEKPWVKKKYTIWMGDMFEWSIPIHLPQAMRMQNIRTQDQWEFLEHKIKQEKPLLFLAGNHEYRLIRHGYGYDPFEKLCAQYKIPYSRKDMFMNIVWNKKWHTWYLNHGYGSSYYPDSAFKSLAARGVLNNVDFAAMGHTHHNWIGGRLQFNINKKEVTTKYQHWIRTGSFLTNPEYTKTLRPELIGNVIVTFDSTKKGPIISQTLDQWENQYG